MAFSEDYNLLCDKNLKSELETKLETVMSLNANITQISNDFLQKIEDDMQSVITAGFTNTEDFLSCHRRLEWAISFFKDIHRKAQENIDLSYHLEGIGKSVDRLLPGQQLKKFEKQGSVEHALVKFTEDQSKLQKIQERKLTLKYLAFEDMTQQRNAEIQSELLKQKVKLMNMEKYITDNVDKFNKELARVAAYISNVPDHVEFNCQYKHVSSPGICKLPQNVLPEIEDDIAKLKDDIMSLKYNLSKIMCKSSDDLSQNEQLQIQQCSCDKITEDFDSFKEAFSNQVQVLQEDLRVLKNKKQKMASQVLKLSKQTEEINNIEETMKLNMSELKKMLQKDIEDIRMIVEGLKDKVDNNSYDIDKCWEMLNKRETMEDNLLAKVEALEYVQINDEKVTTESVIGQLNIGLEAVAAQVEDVSAILNAEMCTNLTRLQEAYRALSADQETNTAKNDLTAVIMELGLKYELMKEVVIRKVNDLEIAKRNLQKLNKSVTSRKDLEKEISAIKTSLKHLQACSNGDGTSCIMVEAGTSSQDNKLSNPTDFKTQLSAIPFINFSLGSSPKPQELRLSKKTILRTKHSAPVVKNVQSSIFNKSSNCLENTDYAVGTNSSKNWVNPSPTDTSLFQKSESVSLSVTVKGTEYPFKVVEGTDVDLKNRIIKTRFQCVVFMEEYKDESIEELRWKDYQCKKCLNP